MNYNFCRIHETLRLPPAMAAGVTDRLWGIADIVKELDDWQGAQLAPSQKVPVVNFLFADRTFFQKWRTMSFCCAYPV